MNTLGIELPKLNAYVESGRKRVGGWLGTIDAELFRTLLLSQVRDYHVRGGVAEIGVHHGKSFILLCLAMRNAERAFCIDIFADQSQNLDRSGSGDRQILEENIRIHGVDSGRIVIKEASSLSVKASDIADAAGPIRFFSIDGGHWLEIVHNDCLIAEDCLGDGGIIALDDFHRAEWPDVSAGYFSWYATRRRPIVPFAIGFNKLYLCEEPWRTRYQATIASSPFLKSFLVKMANFQGIDLPVFSEFIYPEMDAIDKRLAFLRIFRPNFYIPASKVGHRITKVLRSIKGRRTR